MKQRTCPPQVALMAEETSGECCQIKWQGRLHWDTRCPRENTDRWELKVLEAKQKQGGGA